MRKHQMLRLTDAMRVVEDVVVAYKGQDLGFFSAIGLIEWSWGQRLRELGLNTHVYYERMRQVYSNSKIENNE